MVRKSLIGATLLLLVGATALFAAGEAEAAAEAGPAEIRVVMSDRGTGSINPESPVFQEVMERTNTVLKFELVPGSDYTQKMRTLIATDDVPDVLRVGTRELIDFGDAGVFTPLNDYIESSMPNFRALLDQPENQDVWKTAVDGTLYAFPTLKRVEFNRGIISVIRTDKLEELGLDMPQDFDELRDALAAFLADDPESYPWTNRGGTRNLLNTVSYAWGTGNGIYYDKDLGRYSYGPVTDRFKDLLEYMSGLYADGILDPDVVSLSAQQFRERLGSGKSFFFYDNPTEGKRANDAVIAVDEGAWFAPTPVLENPYGGRRSLFYDRNVWGQSFALGANSTVVDASIRVFDFLYSDEGADLKTFGIEGEHSERVDGQLRLRPEILEQYRQTSGLGYRVDGIERDLGVGAYGDFTTYIDMNHYRLSWPEYQINWYLKMEEDPAWSSPVLAPPFNADEREEITDITTKVDTILTEAYDRIILGDIPLAAYDNYVERAIDAGALRLEEIYNQAQARYEASR